MIPARYPRTVVSALFLLALGVVVIKLLAWWLEPRTAFFPYSGVQETPSAARLEYSELRIPTPDGETLHGWWLEHPAPRAQVVYWHGNGGNLSLWLPVIADLRQRGLSVMAVDYRGYGASTGSPSERGIYRDAEAATKYFNERLRRTGSPVVFWGRSLGTAVASHAATQTAPDGLVLESAFPDVATLFAGNPVMRLLSSYRFATSRHLEKYSGPLLLVHGDADSLIPFSAGQRVHERATSEAKTFVVLRGADHNESHAAHPAYWPAIDKFLLALAPAGQTGDGARRRE